MKKLIEINNKMLTVVTGGCYCYCYQNPPNMARPTIMIGEVTNEEKCRNDCNTNSLYLGYSECKSELPKLWIPGPPSKETLEIIAMLHKGYGWM